MSSTLWDRTNYTMDTSFILAQYIYEYDIRKANINVLHSIGVIDDEYYAKLNGMAREDRQVEIGYLIKHNDGVYEKLAEGIKKCRQQFFEQNMLEDYEILAIRNDAIFVLGRKCKTTKFGEIEFVLKHTYTSYMKLPSQIELFYSKFFNDKDGHWYGDVDVKGISDEKVQLHASEGGFIHAICVFMDTMESGDYQEALDFVSEMIALLQSRRARLECMRNFDAMSNYTIIAHDTKYGIGNITNGEMKKCIDVKCNLNILRFMYGLAIERTLTS